MFFDKLIMFFYYRTSSIQRKGVTFNLLLLGENGIGNFFNLMGFYKERLIIIHFIIVLNINLNVNSYYYFF